MVTPSTTARLKMARMKALKAKKAKAAGKPKELPQPSFEPIPAQAEITPSVTSPEPRMSFWAWLKGTFRSEAWVK